MGLENPNSGLDPGETFFLTAVAISIATRPFKFREMSVSISTRSFVFSIHSFGCPLWRPRDKLKAIFDKKKDKKNFSCIVQFLVIKTLDPYTDPDSLKMLDPDPDAMSPDPQLCFEQVGNETFT